MREAASLVIARELVAEQAIVVAYDPIAINKAKAVLPKEVIYASHVEEALKDADAAMILTEWDEFRQLDLSVYVKQMKTPIILMDVIVTRLKMSKICNRILFDRAKANEVRQE